LSRRLQFAAGIGLSALLLWIFLREADFAAVGAELRGAEYRWVVLGAALSVATIGYRALRWHYLLLPIRSVALWPLASCTFMGWAFTSLLPGRLGEVARPVLLGRREGISKTATFATIVLERLFDLLAVLVILVVYLLAFPLPASIEGEGAAVMAAMRLSGVVALAVLLVAMAFVVGTQLWPRRVDAVMAAVAGRLPGRLGDKLLPIGRRFLEGLTGIREPRLLAAIVLHSLGIWFVVLISYYLMFNAFDIRLPFYATMPLVVLLVIGVMVPTPGAVGSFHAAAQIGLATLWGVPNDQAISYAIVTHAAVFVPITLIGILLLAREGMSVRSFEELEDS